MCGRLEARAYVEKLMYFMNGEKLMNVFQNDGGLYWISIWLFDFFILEGNINGKCLGYYNFYYNSLQIYVVFLMSYMWEFIINEIIQKIIIS